MMSNMSDETEHEVEIELPEAEVESDAGASAPAEAAQPPSKDDELSDYSKNVQQRIKKLTERMRKEERDKQEALRLSQQLLDENRKMKDRLQLLDRGYVTEYGNRLTVELSAARAAYKDAADRGDSDKMLEAQEKLARLTNELERHKVAKARVERAVPQAQQPQQQPAFEQQPAAPQQPAATPDPKAQSWAKKNEWFGADRLLTSAAYAIHATLVEDEGFDPNSDEYYSEIDRRIRTEFPHKFQTKKSGEVPPVASGVSSASRSQKSGRRSVKLSPSQVAMAKRLNVPLEEYAKFVKD
jgi:hypothetical protein